MTIFVDTSALFAVLDADDDAHGQADRTWRRLLTEEEPLLTTNYVLVETFALVQRRLGMGALETLSTDLTPVLSVHWVDEAQHARAVTAVLAARRRRLSLVDCATVTGDGGLVAERRLRAGEEIEIVASFRARDGVPHDASDAGPYRDAAAGFEAGPDEVGPPRVSYRTLEGMERSRIDDATGFLRGAGALTIARAKTASVALKTVTDARKKSRSGRTRDGTTLEVIKVFLQVQDGKKIQGSSDGCGALPRLARPWQSDSQRSERRALAAQPCK